VVDDALYLVKEKSVVCWQLYLLAAGAVAGGFVVGERAVVPAVARETAGDKVEEEGG
jgi:hypothetical protein